MRLSSHQRGSRDVGDCSFVRCDECSYLPLHPGAPVMASRHAADPQSPHPQPLSLSSGLLASIHTSARSADHSSCPKSSRRAYPLSIDRLLIAVHTVATASESPQCAVGSQCLCAVGIRLLGMYHRKCALRGRGSCGGCVRGAGRGGWQAGGQAMWVWCWV